MIDEVLGGMAGKVGCEYTAGSKKLLNLVG